MSKKVLTPFVATHPGEMIKDELTMMSDVVIEYEKEHYPIAKPTVAQLIQLSLDEKNMSQKQLAEETGIKASVLSETINGKRSVSLSVAVALEKALGISADIWMNMQTQYDLDTANIAERDNQRETVAVTIPMRDRNLLQELVRKFGWACVF